MSAAPSPNTKAILLLTAPLIAGKNRARADLLSPREYNQLAARMHELGREPADLLGTSAGAVFQECDPTLDRDRLERLLARSMALAQAVEHWQARAIWVISRSDATYPRRFRRLGGNSPVLLFGCGERDAVDKGGLAVVGSRAVDDELIAYTEEIGALAAQAGVAIVSGGARGVDQASMRGSLQAGGNAVGVLADSLERAALARDSREPLIEGRLVLVSPYDPAARFNVGHAMQRNKLIYALSDAALVVNSDVGKGGTWTGAVEQLNKLALVPVFVRSTGRAAPGLDALIEQGARPWPNPDRGDDLASVFSADVEPVAPTSVQGEFSFRERSAIDGSDDVRDAPLADNAADDAADERRKK